MKYLINLCISLLACIAFSACSSDDPIDDTPPTPNQPAQHNDDKWEVEILGDITRGFTFDGDDASITFNTSETIYVEYNGEAVGSLHPAEDAQTTILSGWLKTVNYVANQKLTLYYYGPDKTSAPTYTDQAGTATYIQSNYAYSKAEATITGVDTGAHKLTIEKANFKGQQAIVEFKFDKALSANDVITITGSNISTASVTLPAAVSANASIYVALPVTSASAAALNFIINHEGTAGYFNGASTAKAIANGKYYTGASIALTQWDNKYGTSHTSSGTTPAGTGIIVNRDSEYGAGQSW